MKCDEKPGICLNCERLNLECQKSDGTVIQPPTPDPSIPLIRSASPQSGEGGLKRKRTFRSCARCRASKARCTGQKPQCARCREKQVSCVYEEDSAPQWEKLVKTTRVEHNETSNSGSQASHNVRDAADDAIQSREISNSEARSPSQTTMSTYISQPANTGLRIEIPPQPERPSSLHRHASSVRDATTEEGPDSLDWLYKPHLPSRQRTRMLVKEYFENIHPLRCYAFIHRPSFLQRIEESSNEDHDRNSLLHIVCALGAKFYALQYTSTLKPVPSRTILSSGNAWAKRAQALLFAELGTISVQNLMTAVLLHDHEIRVGDYASAFVITGTITRMAQALQLNLEYSKEIFHDEPHNGPTVCSKEARRRLMWSCYVLDTLIGSGVDQLTLFSEPDIKIQLPCNERNFVLQVPCVTEMLQVGRFLPFIATEHIPPRAIDNIGIVALYIRLMSVRKQVLRYERLSAIAQ